MPANRALLILAAFLLILAALVAQGVVLGAIRAETLGLGGLAAWALSGAA